MGQPTSDDALDRILHVGGFAQCYSRFSREHPYFSFFGFLETYPWLMRDSSRRMKWNIHHNEYLGPLGVGLIVKKAYEERSSKERDLWFESFVFGTQDTVLKLHHAPRHSRAFVEMPEEGIRSSVKLRLYSPLDEHSIGDKILAAYGAVLGPLPRLATVDGQNVLNRPYFHERA